MTDPVRVLCVTPSGFDGRGGIDRLYYYLRRFSAPETLAGVDLRFAAARGGSAVWPLVFPWRLLVLARTLRAFRPQVVHINFANRGSAWRKYAVLRMARAMGMRVAVHLHDSLPLEALARGAIAGRLFLAICHSADIVIVLGEASAIALHSQGVPAAKVRIVLNGIPDFLSATDFSKPRSGTVSVLLAGRVGEHKGVGSLIEALAILTRRGIGGWHCVVAGDGDVAAYSARAASLGLSGRVSFTGWLDAEAVHGLMREADIVVLPSVAEALPLSLLEGACAGAALVATPVGNIAEVVRDGENGRLVTRDPKFLADTLAALIADRDGLARMQAASRRRYTECFTLDTFAAGLAAVYAELAEAGGTKTIEAGGTETARSREHSIVSIDPQRRSA